MTKEKYPVFMSIITADIIDKIIDRYGYDENEAIYKFHKSTLYKLLEQEDTKMWHYSTEMLVYLFDGEMNGKLELPEV